MNPIITAMWYPFREIPSAVDAALISGNCHYSLATPEVICGPDAATFALIEREHEVVWHWTIISSDGLFLSAGREPTQDLAKKSAMENLLRVTA